MKKNGAGIALLTPDAHGWRVHPAGGVTQTTRTLDEAAAAIPANQTVHLALPCHAAVLERLTLPSLDRAELAGMVQLQLEKTLPYGAEQVSSDFEVLSQSENESTLLSIAAASSQLEELCQPLRSRARLPQKITLYAAHVAASCPPDQVALCIWEEDGQLVLAICEHGKLGFAQTLPDPHADTLMGELPQILLTAELAGVPTEFASVRVEQGCAHLQEPLAAWFEKPVELVTFGAVLPEAGGNLVPAEWQTEIRRMQRSGRLRQQLQLAAIAYLVLVAAGFVYLALLKRGVQRLDRELAETQPQVEFVQAQQARWMALAPAIDPHRSAVEIMALIEENRPTEELKLTVFDYTPAQFSIQGEGPSADLVFEYLEKLRAAKGLKDFNMEMPAQPSILPNGSAQFRIFGKL